MLHQRGRRDWRAVPSANLSAFQTCLPDALEQEFLRAAFLDVEGAKRWAAEVETVDATGLERVN